MKNVLFAIVMVSLAACNTELVGPPSPFTPVVTTVSINVTAAQIEAGRTITLIPTVKDQRDSVMTGRTVTWASSNTTVATVSNGVVTGVARGQSTIVASADGKAASATIFVTDATVASVTLNAVFPSTFFVGQSIQATATARDLNNNVLTTYAVTWTSSHPAAVSVNSTGLITAVSAGVSTVTASAGGKSATVTVTTSLVPVSTVTVATVGTAKIGRSIQMSKTLKSADGTTLTVDQRSFSWASTDSTIATISSSGILTGISEGSTIITCVVEGKVGLLTVTVSEVVIDHIVVTPDSSSVVVGATKQLSATAFDVDSVSVSVPALNGRTFVWTSSSNAKAVISSTGLVTAIATGTANMTATIGAKSGVGVITIP